VKSPDGKVALVDKIEIEFEDNDATRRLGLAAPIILAAVLSTVTFLFNSTVNEYFIKRKYRKNLFDVVEVYLQFVIQEIRAQRVGIDDIPPPPLELMTMKITDIPRGGIRDGSLIKIIEELRNVYSRRSRMDIGEFEVWCDKLLRRISRVAVFKATRS
jgi:hypothetical protein